MNIFSLGTILIWVVAGLSVWTLVTGILGYIRKSSTLQTSAVHAGLGIFPLVLAASGILVWGFLNDRFDVHYIAYNSERAMPIFYKFSAFWGSLDGSLLLWLLVLSFFSALSLQVHRRKDADLIGVVAAVLAAVMGFFAFTILLTNDPFAAFDIIDPATGLAYVPPDGQGLNPLLQNPGMIFHPPMLYLGFVGFTIPFAFAMAALITNKLDARWVRTTRVWTIIAWVALTLGNILGANWAYVELGWGGYWGWDPVENSSFMPWLTGTAFLHSVMIQEKRGMMKVWNVGLILLTFWLTLFGTFLTRSGVVSSVHAFSESSIGAIFLGFLAVVMIVSLALLLLRWDSLQPEGSIESPFSREAAFLYNNILFLLIAGIILWGTTWPILAEALTGKKASVGAPLFNEMGALPALALLFLTGVGPVLSWRKMTVKKLREALQWPLVISIGVALLEAAIGSTHYFAIATFAFGALTLILIFLDYYKGIRARQKTKGDNPVKALYNLFQRNPRRYAGYIVHIGIVMAFFAIAGNFFAKEKTVVMKVGETIEFVGNKITLKEVRSFHRRNYDSTMSVFDVTLPSGKTIQMWPERRSYTGKKKESSTEVSIHSTPLRDLYLIMLGTVDSQRVSFRFHVNPLVQLLWGGGFVMAFGALLGISIRRRKPTAV